ncbi:hypothetical protein KUV56_06590 [Ferrimonas balearica]|uniref:hypothetical protein n=1 Tax=Ferrimonas balearica TaxID=44012 RepID=UPI001C568B96|nr:hypothetical protein [Ferrimonas balearica]MBW3139198.1 hypothetical protein [Ferrimonas balearica]
MSDRDSDDRNSLGLRIAKRSKVTDRYSLIKKFFVIDDGPLYRVPLFWFATILPTVGAIFLTIPISKNLTLDLSSDGYSLFLSYFSLPLGLLSTSVIFGAIVSRVHRSKQSHSQINESSRNNKFTNFLSHRREFSEIVRSGTYEVDYSVIKCENSLVGKLKFTINPSILHHYLFPNLNSEHNDLQMADRCSYFIFSSKLRFGADIFEFNDSLMDDYHEMIYSMSRMGISPPNLELLKRESDIASAFICASLVAVYTAQELALPLCSNSEKVRLHMNITKEELLILCKSMKVGIGHLDFSHYAN